MSPIYLEFVGQHSRVLCPVFGPGEEMASGGPSSSLPASVRMLLRRQGGTRQEDDSEHRLKPEMF